MAALKNTTFNPTLVRLRRVAYMGYAIIQMFFQSHAGSIEARPTTRRTRTFSALSIPRWFD